jgi:hypothetical protein
MIMFCRPDVVDERCGDYVKEHQLHVGTVDPQGHPYFASSPDYENLELLIIVCTKRRDINHYRVSLVHFFDPEFDTCWKMFFGTGPNVGLYFPYCGISLPFVKSAGYPDFDHDAGIA